MPHNIRDPKSKKYTGWLRITAKPEAGFWRADMFHKTEPVEHPPETFTEYQVGLLKAERNLVVQEMEPPPASIAAAAKS